MLMKAQRGFTLLELVVVASMISALAAVAVPAYTDYSRRSMVAEGLILVEPLKRNITDYYAWHGELPADNQSAGLLLPEQLQGSYVSALTIEQGTIRITYGNHTDAALHDKSLSIIPQLAVSPLLSLSWICAGLNSGIESGYLPTSCKL